MLQTVPGLLALSFGLTCWADTLTLDDFSQSIEAWQPALRYGETEEVRVSLDEGVAGSNALRIDYGFTGVGTNHVLYSREFSEGVGAAEKLAFSVRGAGDRVELFLFVFDSEGRMNNYGPHGQHPDFHSGYADWHRCEVNLDDDPAFQGGEADLQDIRKIGVFLWGMGPKTGSVWIDDLVMVEGEPRLTCLPAEISPNGDGVYDSAALRLRVPGEATAVVQVLDATGAVVDTPVSGEAVRGGALQVQWPPEQGAQAPAAGQYTVRATLTGGTETVLTANLTAIDLPPWPPIAYQAEPFFPVGVWFEGAPSMNRGGDTPQQARSYYDFCFSDMAAHGINAVAVPNCPESLWEALLQSAEEHGIKVCLEVGPLVGLVSRTDPATETEVAAAVETVVEKIGGYDSLLRYQIRDEPFDLMLPNWVLVQRILAAADPTRPAFSCFCSDSGLARLAERTTLSEAVFDIYPLRAADTPPTIGGFQSALDGFRRSSQGNPMWVVLQTFECPPPSWRYPTAEEIRCMTYLSLAAGAKGVFFFIYQYMPDYLHGLIDPLTREPRPLYADVAKLAGELRKLAPLLLNARPGRPATHVIGAVRVGSFETIEGKPLYIISNSEPGDEAEVTVFGVRGAQFTDALTGETVQAAEGKLQMTLGPGQGRVLVAK